MPSQNASVPGEVDVVVVGAGLAGLSAAWELTRAGCNVALLEASDRPGGRVGTDFVDGYTLDRGFQLINPSYPRLGRLAREGALDLKTLDLQPFVPGVRVVLRGREAVLADPLRSPRDALATLTAPVGSMREKLAFAAWALRCSRSPVSRLMRSADRPYGRAVAANGIDGALRRSLLEPFLAGVLADDSMGTSTHFVQLLIRSFVRGTPSVPARGVGELPRQLAAALPVGTLQLSTPVRGIADGAVDTDSGRVNGRAVLLATDAGAAAKLTGIPVAPTRALTTFWFTAEEPPLDRALLTVDGLRRGPVVNAAVLSLAAPTYAPAGQALIGCTVLGLPGPATESDVRHHAALLFGTAAGGWRLLRTDAIAGALPAVAAPLQLAKAAKIGDRLFIAGDHRDTASQQGALASGGRVARQIIAELSGRSQLHYGDHDL